MVPDTTGTPEVTVGADGVITRRTSPASTAAITGDGTIDNGGAITLPTDAIDPTLVVTNHHYRVTFDTQGGSTAPDPVTVFADTFTHGDRTFPPDPTKAGVVFMGWNTAADGSGDTFYDDTPLPGSSADGTAHPVPLYAQYGDPTASLPALKVALANCTDTLPTPYTVALTADLADPGLQLVARCDAKIDLAGHDLTVRNVIVSAGHTLEVTDTTATPGTLRAEASGVKYTAGIRTTGATLTTSGTAHVIATGGDYSAGIGGRHSDAGGTTISNDTSTITATGGNWGAGRRR